jgi:multidrug efflux pump subunit AcrB
MFNSLIKIFVNHRNAANLLMVMMMAVGVVGIQRLNTQFFPDFGIDVVSVQVIWPGASAEDVEANIVAAIEPEVRFLNNVTKTNSYAVEGSAIVVLEFDQSTDMNSALSEVESAIARITTFPEESEKPVIQQPVRYDTITKILLSGPYDEAAIKSIAQNLRDQLLNNGADRVVLFGARSEEITIDIAPATLRQMNLTLQDVARIVGSNSLDMPSGNIAGGQEQQIRSLGQMQSARELAQIEVRALENGERILIRDIATVREGFDDDEPTVSRQGYAAIELNVQRSTKADALKVAAAVDDFIKKIRPTLPRDLRVEIFDVQSGLIQERIDILVKNGMGGLILVLVTLFVFLNIRVAFWVAMGVPAALLATMFVMLMTGQSINMISLFALIMTLGIIVDDAIVVAEHAVTQRSRGLSAILAAEKGALRMLVPVIASSLTTIATFMPILMIGDIIGTLMQAIPLVVVTVLIVSLVECFLVLPGHMRGAMKKGVEHDSRPRQWFNRKFNHFRDHAFRAVVRFCVGWRYLTLAVAIALMMLCIGIVSGGRIGFNFFPSPEADIVLANVVMDPGTPRKQTGRMTAELERAARVVEEQLTDGKGGLMVLTYGSTGRSQGEQFSRLSGDRYGGVYAELQPSDTRTIRTATFIEAWRNEIREIPGVQQISLRERLGGPPGKEIDIRLSNGEAHELKAAALEVRDLLNRFPGVSDVEDDLPTGKREVILSLTPRGRAMGFTTESVARQVRNAFEGAIAKRFTRGDDEVTIRVQYPRDAVNIADLYDLFLRGPNGDEAALSEVVAIDRKVGFARVRREDGKREVAVFGEINETVTSQAVLLEAIEVPGLQDIAKKHGITYRFAGKAEEQARTFADMKLGATIGLIAIYVILAWVFASYSRPFVVMSAIPFGIVGAILGHMVMGFDLTVLSLVGLLGVSGILVNDSIILVTTIDERIRNGEPVHAAIIQGAQDRLRAVLLTSLTTIGGLAPLLTEKSLQAQFLLPMAITIVFGLAVATSLILFVVPALMAIQYDFSRFFRWLFTGRTERLSAPEGAGK